MSNESNAYDIKKDLENIELKIQVFTFKELDSRVLRINQFYQRLILGLVGLLIAFFGSGIAYMGWNQRENITKQVEQKIREENIPALINSKVEANITKAIDEASIRNLAIKLTEELVKQKVASQINQVRTNLEAISTEQADILRRKVEDIIRIAQQDYSQRITQDEGKLAELLNAEPGKDVKKFIFYLEEEIRKPNINDIDSLKQAINNSLINYRESLNEVAFYTYLGTYDYNNRQWVEIMFTAEGNRALSDPSTITAGSVLVASTNVNARQTSPNIVRGRIKLGDEIGILNKNDKIRLIRAPIKLEVNNGRAYLTVEARRIRS